MANLVGNAWSVDAADASANALATGYGTLQGLYWDNGIGGAADNHCEVTDGDGHVIFHAHAAAKDYATGITFPKGLTIRGIIVPSLSAGTLILYWEHTKTPK